MEHEDRNDQIRQKLLAEIGDIEAFTANRDIEELSSRQDVPKVYCNVSD